MKDIKYYQSPDKKTKENDLIIPNKEEKTFFVDFSLLDDMEIPEKAKEGIKQETKELGSLLHEYWIVYRDCDIIVHYSIRYICEKNRFTPIYYAYEQSDGKIEAVCSDYAVHREKTKINDQQGGDDDHQVDKCYGVFSCFMGILFACAAKFTCIEEMYLITVILVLFGVAVFFVDYEKYIK